MLYLTLRKYNIWSIHLTLIVNTLHFTGWLQAEDPQSAGVGGVCRGQLGRALQP